MAPSLSLSLFLLFLSIPAPDSAAAEPSNSLIQTGPVSADTAKELYCESWRLGVETNNIRFWWTIPARCRRFVHEYMSSERYALDSDVVATESLAFAATVRVGDDGKDAWVFDIDDTLLSNMPYYASNGYGSKPFNKTAFIEWVNSARAQAIPASLRMYEDLYVLGFQLVLLSGRSESQRNITEKNLLLAGYHSWNSLILRGASDISKNSMVFKSKKRADLEAQGFRIHGNCGDQWSDLLGSPMAERSFKLPNPMYFVN